MNSKLSIFLNKKILIYGLGKSGLSTFNFLNNKSDVFLFDDFQKKNETLNIKKKIISYKKILKINFDKIILSPGIDINKCKLKKFLKKNYSKIHTDLDIFNIFFKNNCITITGTNGKSTTCKLLFEVLSDQKFDVRLVGNIGNPILSSKNIKKKTIFIVEASSYQLEYSKIFKTKHAAILNLYPDHIDRHITMNNYVKAKFKLLKNQLKGNFAFVNKDDPFISKELRFNKFKSKIIKVSIKKNEKFLKKIKNKYFLNESNQENLLFVLEISKRLNLKKNLLLKTIQNFNGLQYRQQIILKKRNLTIINDSKSTSFSASVGALKSNNNIYWLLGGIHKKGDKFDLQKKYFKNIKAYIYGKNKRFFNKNLKGKIEYENFDDLDKALKKILIVIKKNKFIHSTILFSPCAASFDNFKNFEDRGNYFNKLIKKYFNGI
tara:strand:+ start:327 stop:1628 length:1302 start_codon:yes stop_codon:yes gene_type:complete